MTSSSLYLWYISNDSNFQASNKIYLITTTIFFSWLDVFISVPLLSTSTSTSFPQVSP